MPEDTPVIEAKSVKPKNALEIDEFFIDTKTGSLILVDENGKHHTINFGASPSIAILRSINKQYKQVSTNVWRTTMPCLWKNY